MLPKSCAIEHHIPIRCLTAWVSSYPCIFHTNQYTLVKESRGC